ncbi:ribonuclease H-like domain-containing protein [Tanacetum coccineum]|uniref:Ribonuclease H-like domain-containing protein n=1 Tax=Tanacetum coccineum TaxID=301880 RepID=A0ABQ5C5R3_9ASTR
MLPVCWTKASLDESTKWHRRMAHVNFKNMNKLAKHGLVNGLPSKLFSIWSTSVLLPATRKAKHDGFLHGHLGSSGLIPIKTRTYATSVWESSQHQLYKILRKMEVYLRRLWANQKGSHHGISRLAMSSQKPRTLIEAARTMLADSKLPTTFWAEVVNTACYVQNRALVVKPYNKTPYELFHGRTPTLSFMRPIGYPVTILNTINHLGKFDGKADEGFFVGYSLNSKAFRVFNSRTRIVEENLHIRFSESTPNVVGSRPDWLFDIDALTRTINYEPIVAGTQSNGFADSKASDNASQARKETKPIKIYILLSLWPA